MINRTPSDRNVWNVASVDPASARCCTDSRKIVRSEK